MHFIGNLGIIGSVESYKSPTFDITVFKLCNAFQQQKHQECQDHKLFNFSIKMTKIIQNHKLFNGINQSKPTFFADIREKCKFERCHFRKATNIDVETCRDEKKFLEAMLHLLKFNQLMLIIVIDSSIPETEVEEIIELVEQWKAAAEVDDAGNNTNNSDITTTSISQWKKIISIEFIDFDVFYKDYPTCSSLYMGSDFPKVSLKTPPKQYPTDIISQFLYLGNYYDATDAIILNELGITHVVDATSEELSRQNVQNNMHLEYLSIPIWDIEGVNIMEHFDNVINFINTAKIQNSNNKILIHCRAGISRSATFVIAYLMHSHIVSSLKDALTLVVTERPYILPNISFRSQLMEYETILYNNQSFNNNSDKEFLTHISTMNYCWSGIFSLESDFDKIPIIAMGQKLNSIKLTDMYPSEQEKKNVKIVPKKAFLKRNTGKMTSIQEKQHNTTATTATTSSTTTASSSSSSTGNNKPLSIRELRAQLKQQHQQEQHQSCNTEIDVVVKEKL